MNGLAVNANLDMPKIYIKLELLSDESIDHGTTLSPRSSAQLSQEITGIITENNRTFILYRTRAMKKHLHTYGNKENDQEV